MLDAFKHIPSLENLCGILGKDEDSLDDLIWLIGCKTVEKASVLDILVETGFVDSKTRFRKNPQTVMIDGQKVSIDSIPEESGFVLSVGKAASFKCTFVRFL